MNDLRAQGALLLLVLAVALPAGHLSAEELTLRCDPQRQGDSVLVAIDMSRRTVQIGKDSFADKNEHLIAADIYRTGPGHENCSWDITQFVNITNDKIQFGELWKPSDCGQYSATENINMSFSM